MQPLYRNIAMELLNNNSVPAKNREVVLINALDDIQSWAAPVQPTGMLKGPMMHLPRSTDLTSKLG